MAICVCVLGLTACSTAFTNEPGMPAAAIPSQSTVIQSDKRGDTLYDALGGAAGVEVLAEKFIIELAADDRVRHRFERSDIGRFHRMLQLHICELAEGPCTYTGDSMRRTHAGMNIQSAEFNALVEALMRAMDKLELQPGVQNRLLAILAPMRSDIVGH